jgi:MraZ protein
MSDNADNGGKSEDSVRTPVVGVFIGLFLHAMDAKRRLTIPLEWRQQVGAPESLFIAPIHEKCLYVLPGGELRRRLAKSAGHSLADVEASESDRDLGSQSELLSWDSQGRIRIRDDLLEYAELADQVALVGAFERFEIWNPKTWEKYRTARERDAGDVARRLGL